MNGYGIALAAVILLCAVLYVALSRRGIGLPAAMLVSGTAALAGLLGARLIYWLGALDFFIGRTQNVLSLFWWTDGGFSLFGAVAGAAGASALLTRQLKLPAQALDSLSLPLLLLAAEGRLLEWTALGLNFGLYCDQASWLTVTGEWGEQLNVALIEAVLIALLAVILLLRVRREGTIPLRHALLLLGVAETLMISMRRDHYMMWGFVHQEQLYFFLLSALMAVICWRERGKPLTGFLTALVTACVVIFLEFALDGRILVPFDFLRDEADLFWYALMVLALTVYAVLCLRRGKENQRS